FHAQSPARSPTGGGLAAAQGRYEGRAIPWRQDHSKNAGQPRRCFLSFQEYIAGNVTNRNCSRMTPEARTDNQTSTKAGATIIPVTPFRQNCTLLWCEAARDAVVIDPGGDVPLIRRTIDKAGVSVKQIWLTHGHID